MKFQIQHEFLQEAEIMCVHYSIAILRENATLWKKIELKLTCQFPNDADRTPLNIHLDENSKVIHLNVCPDLLQMFLHRDILMFQQIV